MNERELLSLIAGAVVIVLFFVGLSLVNDSSQAADFRNRLYRLDFYADHHHPRLTDRTFLPLIFQHGSSYSQTLTPPLAPTSTNSPTPSATAPTPTHTTSPTSTPTGTATSTPTGTATSTATPVPTPTHTNTPTTTLTPTEPVTNTITSSL